VRACVCYRSDGVVEVHELPHGDPVLVKLILQDLELSCERVECFRDKSVIEVRAGG